jgi:transposase
MWRVTLVVTPEGFPLAYEVLAGNTSDKTTLKDFLKKIEDQYGKAQRIWVMDRGIPTEEVLQEMRSSDPPVYYLVGTPKARLKKFEADLLGQPWENVREGVDVKLQSQEGELYVFAQSRDRIAKERSMRVRQLRGLLHRLKALQIMKLSSKNLLLKLGEAKARYRAAWRLFDFDLPEAKSQDKAASFGFRLNRKRLREVRRREGRYLLRTNLCQRDPVELWSFYIQLVEIEAVFKTLKDDLSLRPFFHRREDRIEAHIFVAFLAYCLHVTLRARLRALAPGLTPRRSRQVRCHPNARCSLPNHRWTHPDLEPLHPARGRPENPPRATASPAPCAASSPNYLKKHPPSLTLPHPM